MRQSIMVDVRSIDILEPDRITICAIGCLVILIFILSACTFGETETPDLSQVALHTPAVIHAYGTQAPIIPPPTQKIDTTHEASPNTLSHLGLTPSPVTSLVSNPSPEVEKPLICSPLDGIDRAELTQIVSAPYDPPPMGRDERHHGVDFSFYRRGDLTTIEGVAVKSIFSGRVAAAIRASFPFGNVVIIESTAADLPSEILSRIDLGRGQSLYVLYAHLLERPAVEMGETITCCQVLGQVGASGNAVEPHLHLEMRIGPAESVFDGMSFYTTQATQEERENYQRWRTSGLFQHLDPITILVP